MKSLNSLWYERLGETHSFLYDFKSAADAYKKAVELDGGLSRTSLEGLGWALAGNGELALAISEMEKAMAVPWIATTTEEKKKSTVANLMTRAEWKGRLELNDSALTLYREVLEMDRENTKAYYSMLDILLASSKDQQALNFVTKLGQQLKETPDGSELCSVFRAVASEGSDETIFDRMFAVCQDTAIFGIVMENIECAIGLTRAEYLSDELSVLLLNKGMALYHYDQHNRKSPEIALKLWETCSEMDPIHPTCRAGYCIAILAEFSI